MKNLTGPIILLSAFSLAVAVAEPPAANPSEKLGMIDTLSAVATDTMTLDSFQHVGMPVMTSGKWFYTPVAEMPDPSLQGWWLGFNDPLLDSLISMAVQNNHDIRMSDRRIELARLALRQVQSGYYPAISGQAGYTTDRISGLSGRRRGMESTANYFTLGLDASWEVDLFGRIRQQSKVSQADIAVSRADYASTLVSLCSQLTEDYIQLRVYQAQLDVARRLSKSQQEVVRIATVRHDCELAPGLDVSHARTVLLSTQATIPALRTSVSNAIMVLTGNPSEQLAATLATVRPIPLYAMPMDADITPELLRRRPDIQAAEQQVAAYAAQTGVAKKDFLPTLTLKASIGSSAHRLSNLFDHDAMTYSVQPTLSWTIFSGLSRKYALAAAKEQMMIGIDNYNFTVQQATAEVDNALVAYRNSIIRIGMLNEVLAESIKSFDFSLDQYKQGLSPFLNLINAQIDVLDYNNQLVAERGNSQIAVINLYKALDGGW